MKGSGEEIRKRFIIEFGAGDQIYIVNCGLTVYVRV